MDRAIKKFILRFLRTRGETARDWAFELLRGDDSKRAFWRIPASGQGRAYIAMANPPIDRASKQENRAYLMIGRHLRDKGVSAPEIYHYDLDRGWCILEDLGSTNGTFVNSYRLTGPVQFRPGDVLSLGGSVELVLQAGG